MKIHNIFLVVLMCWMMLALMTTFVQAEMPILETIKVNDINNKWPSGTGGAIERSRMIIEEIRDMEPKGSMRFGQNCQNLRPVSPNKTRAQEAYGWNAYVSQDAVSSWKPRLGITAYVVQGFSR